MKQKTSNDELNRLTEEEFKATKKLPVVLVLDNVRSMHNVGAAFRTADAFLIESIYLCGITAKPPHREIEKTAIGATQTVTWKHFENTMDAIAKLKTNGYKVYTVEQTDEKTWLQDVEVNEHEKIALVFGHEMNGVALEVVQAADANIEIPQWGSKHSLNISVSVGVVLWEVVKKMQFYH